ncbi:MAG: flippase, partial [Cetobacterium sp.]
MKVKNIKINFILNLIRTFLGTFFILITMPYITRVLGSENLGKVEYTNSIVAYFLLFTALGIPSYGIREVARTRNNRKELSKTMIELMLILLITTIVGYCIFFFMIFNVKQLEKEKILLIVMGTNIIFTNIGVQWFYQGIENQMYITIRFIIAKLITLGALFLLVKTQNNYIVYGAIIVGMESGSNIFNLFNLKKYIDIKKEYFKELNIKRHVKPIMTIFVAAVSVSIYLQLDSVMIGSIAGPEYVGFYSVANKLVRFIMVLVTALGAVMMPRLSNCLKVGDKKGYINYANYSLKYILFISIPSMVGVSLIAKQIIEIMAGENFTESVLTMQIISPIIFIVGLAYFIGFQVLYPQGLEKYYTYSVTIAAVINFAFNYTFIPKYYQNGAAMGTVIAELTGVLMMLY